MDIKKIQSLAIIIITFLCLMHNAVAANTWRALSEGIEYLIIQEGKPTPWSRIHVFRIDLKVNELALITADDLALPSAFIQGFTEKNDALLAINGGFFDENFRPLGLRIHQGEQKNPLRPISWWGVFYAKNNTAYLSNFRSFIDTESKNNSNIEFAVQSGPRLLINGKIPSLKPGLAERSALGILHDGRIIILVTEQHPLLTRELAEILQAPPLHCIQALNLDGGHSSQLFARINDFHLDVPGFSKLSDAIIVRPRGNS